MSYVLQITDKGPGDGGIRRVVEDHAELMIAAGWKVTRLRLAREGRASSSDHVHELIAPLPTARGRADEEATIGQMREAARGAEIIHLHLGFTAVTPGFVTFAARLAPLVVSLHDISPFQDGINYVSNFAPLEMLSRLRHAAVRAATWRAICQHASALHAPSGYLADLAIGSGANPARVVVVPHAVPAWDEPLALPTDCDPVAVYCGQLSRPKGAHLLPGLFRAVSHTSARFVVCGDGPIAPKLARSVSRSGMSDRVTMTGAISHSEVLEHISRARVLIHPSLIPEGFGLSVIEAMRLGRPVAGFAHGGTGAWLKHDVTGLVAESGTPEELARHVFTLLTDPVRGTRLGEAGRARVQSECAPDVVRDRLVALFDRAARYSGAHV